MGIKIQQFHCSLDSLHYVLDKSFEKNEKKTSSTDGILFS
jgi:hypothetical protein